MKPHFGIRLSNLLGSSVVVLALATASVAQSGLDSGQNNSVDSQCLSNPALPGCAQRDSQQRTPPNRPVDQTPVIRVAPEQAPGNLENPRTNGLSQQGLPFAAQKKLPAEEPTEFQQFVAGSLGKKLPLFGYNLFEDVPSTFAPANRIPVSADYVIGPGDELLVRAWGQIDINARLIVDRDGLIYLPRIGSINVAGVQYKQLPDFLKANIGRVFRNFDLTVSLGQLRSISIFVVGQARRPGVYTISALSTLVNAVFASGGPSNRGSMRHIQLKRHGQVITDFDMYDLLLKGDMSKDVVLLPGDVISIPPVGPQVAMAGSVNVPAIYELSKTESLKDGIDGAGGLSNVADGDRAIIERIDSHSVRKVDEFKLDPQGMARELHDGDLVRIFRISPRFENAVTIRGNVARPGRFPWHEGMRVRDLIPNKEFLLTNDYWERQNAAGRDRQSKSQFDNNSRSAYSDQAPRDLQQRDMDYRDPDYRDTDHLSPNYPDSLQSAGTRTDSNARALTYEQSVRRDLELRSLRTEEIKNDVRRNAPEINWEYAVIQRLDPATLTTRLLPFNLGKAILEGSDAENISLEPGDIVTIFSQRDLSVSIEKQSKFVRLEGEVRSPGIYKVEPGETLRDVVKRAGGLTDHAYLYGSQLTRESVRADQQRSLNELVRSLELEVQRKAIYNVQARPELQANALAQSQADEAFVDKLRRVQATGRIVLELQPTQTSIDNLPEIALEDGDRFVVPYKPSTVTVVGSVHNQSSFIYKSGSALKQYISLAGNGTRDADTKHMFLIRADGSVVSRDQVSGIWGGGFNSIRTLPGDMIVVPAQLERGTVLRGLKDWSQVISQFGLGIAAVAVLANN